MCKKRIASSLFLSLLLVLAVGSAATCADTATYTITDSELQSLIAELQLIKTEKLNILDALQKALISLDEAAKRIAAYEERTRQLEQKLADYEEMLKQQEEKSRQQEQQLTELLQMRNDLETQLTELLQYFEEWKKAAEAKIKQLRRQRNLAILVAVVEGLILVF